MTPTKNESLPELPEKWRARADAISVSGTWSGDFVAGFIRDCADDLQAALTREAPTEGVNSYAVFEGNGMRIDLVSFFKTESGAKALAKVTECAFRVSQNSRKKAGGGFWMVSSADMESLRKSVSNVVGGVK